MNAKVPSSPALGPPAALESVPAVLVRRAAVFLTLRHRQWRRVGRQPHGRSSLLVGDQGCY